LFKVKVWSPVAGKIIKFEGAGNFEQESTGVTLPILGKN
jgi:hypothetical protein